MSAHVNRGWIIRRSDDKRGMAQFSECEKYRYVLTRSFNPGMECPRHVNFIMLNPSTADQNANDPTVARCEIRARRWGFDGLTVTNLFAWRSTDPSILGSLPDAVGPHNDYYLLHEAKMGASLVVCAWGGHGQINGRAAIVEKMLRENGVPLHYLRISESTGQPWHPLYLPYSLKPTAWVPADA